MRIKSIISIFLILLFFASAARSNVNKDSLTQLLHATNLPSKKIILLNQLSKAYLDEDTERSESYASQALFISESIEDDAGQAEAQYYLALLAIKKFDYQMAFKYLTEAKDIVSKTKDWKQLAKIDHELGILYKRRLEYEKALELLYRASTIFKENDKVNRLAKTYNEIGGIYYDQGNYDKAFEFYQSSLELYVEKNNISGMSKLYNNMGEIYRLKGNYTTALQFYKKSIDINSTGLDNHFLSILYNNIGSIYLGENKLDSADYFLNKSLELSILTNDPERIASVRVNVGKLYYQLGDNDKALSNFQTAYDIAIKESSLWIIQIVSENLSNLYYKKGDKEKAFLFFRQYHHANDTIRNIQNLERIAQLEMKLLFDHETEVRRMQIQKTNLLYFSIATALIFLSILLILLYGRQRIKTQQVKIKADNLELERLHLQDELDYKNRELATNVMYLVKKNELINFISENLLKAKKEFTTKNKELVQQIIVDLQSNVDSNIWNVFQERFVEVHEDFFINLNEKYPKLTDNDKKLCAFIKLDMNTKEIAAITHQNLGSIEVARTRLRKKLKISNIDISLNKFLSQI